MANVTIEVPAMYADHHVLEVRRILSELPGVKDLYASSAFKVVEVEFNPEEISEDDIKAKLDEYGYLGELPLPVEDSIPGYLEEESKAYFRHTEVFETAQNEIGFSQEVANSGRPLWNCPGIGLIKTKMED